MQKTANSLLESQKKEAAQVLKPTNLDIGMEGEKLIEEHFLKAQGLPYLKLIDLRRWSLEILSREKFLKERASFWHSLGLLGEGVYLPPNERESEIQNFDRVKASLPLTASERKRLRLIFEKNRNHFKESKLTPERRKEHARLTAEERLGLIWGKNQTFKKSKMFNRRLAAEYGTGVMDFIVRLPNGQLGFVEVKANSSNLSHSSKLSPRQIAFMKEAKTQGFDVLLFHVHVQEGGGSNLESNAS
jgi:hypothetical protein